jgi:hypothetical protein
MMPPGQPMSSAASAKPAPFAIVSATSEQAVR